MSNSDFGGSDDSPKKHHQKKTKHVDDKRKSQKRSRSFERNDDEKSYKEKKKQKNENVSKHDEEREYNRSDNKSRKKYIDTKDEKTRERKRRSGSLEEESESENERGRKKRNESNNKERQEEKSDSKKLRKKVQDSKGRRAGNMSEDEDKNKSNSKYDEVSEKRYKKGSSRIEYDEHSLQKNTSSKYEENEEERPKKSTSRYDKSRDNDGKKPHKRRYETTDENDYKEGKYDRSDDDEDKFRSNQEKPQRYWSNPRPMRENCDIYWNKFSDRFKKSAESLEVGPRYYSSGEKPRRDQRDREDKKEKEKGDDGADGSKPNDVQNEEKEEEKAAPPKRTKTFDALTSRTGGAYIPPAKLRMMQESITDKGSAAFQRLAWEALKKSIQGHVNKVNVSNIVGVIKAIQKENIVRGKGLLCRALIQAQAASPTFTNVYAALVAVLNARFPKIGELLLKRLVVQFRRGFKRNDKTICITAATFIAHLVNQEVAHEILALEILTLLIETPTDDSVEVAIAFLKECGMKLTEVASKGIMGIFDMLRNILHEGKLEKRVQYMIEVMFQIRKEDFKAHPSLIDDLDLVEQEDKITHLISLEDNHDPEDILNVFKFDPDYEANEAKYKSLVQDDDEEDEGSDGGESGSDSDDESEEDGEENKEKQDLIVDRTETNLVALRKTIYLTIQSSLDFEECAHKLLKMELKPGQEIEMAHMFLDCCAEQRTYEKFFGLLSQRFCQINRSYIAPFEQTFRDSYATIHRMSNDKLRNIAKLFAHLLYTDAISWEVLSTIRLNEEDTTSSSRIFIKILFQELSEYMGLVKLNQRVKDPALQPALEGLFPRDNPQHTRFAINFFTSIGLGGITDELREHLKSMPRPTAAVNQLVENLSSSSDSSSSDSSSDSSSSSDDSSNSSDSSSSDSEEESKKKKKKGKPVSIKKETLHRKSENTSKKEKEKSSRKDKESTSRKEKENTSRKQKEDSSRNQKEDTSRKQKESTSKKDKEKSRSNSYRRKRERS